MRGTISETGWLPCNPEPRNLAKCKTIVESEAAASNRLNRLSGFPVATRENPCPAINLQFIKTMR